MSFSGRRPRRLSTPTIPSLPAWASSVLVRCCRRKTKTIPSPKLKIGRLVHRVRRGEINGEGIIAAPLIVAVKQLQRNGDCIVNRRPWTTERRPETLRHAFHSFF